MNRKNRSTVLVPILLLLLCTSCATWHQRKVNQVSGLYRSTDNKGVLYEITLRTDQTFMYREVRGLVTESATGTWTKEGRKLKLNTFEQPEDLETYTPLTREPFKSDSLRLKIVEADTKEELFLAHWL